MDLKSLVIYLIRGDGAFKVGFSQRDITDRLGAFGHGLKTVATVDGTKRQEGLLHGLLPRNFVHRQLTGRAGVFKAVAIGVPLPFMIRSMINCLSIAWLTAWRARLSLKAPDLQSSGSVEVPTAQSPALSRMSPNFVI